MATTSVVGWCTPAPAVAGLETPLEVRHVPPRERHKRIGEALELVGQGLMDRSCRPAHLVVPDPRRGTIYNRGRMGQLRRGEGASHAKWPSVPETIVDSSGTASAGKRLCSEHARCRGPEAVRVEDRH